MISTLKLIPMKYRIKIISKKSGDIMYVPQWKTHWFTSWDNEVFIGREGYIDILHAYNDIKRWQNQEQLFNKVKFKSVQYINLPLLNFISTSESDITAGCNPSHGNIKTSK
jgi:hypothetical protein